MPKDTKTPESTVHLNDHVLELADKIAKGMTVDKKTGVGAEKEDLFEGNLPEGLSMDTIKQVSDYNSTFIAAGAYAFGKLAVEAMKSNKELDKATAEIKMGHKDSVSYTVDRKKEFTNHLGGTGDKVEKFGVVTASFDVRAGKNGGQLKIARQLIGEMGADFLKKS